MGLEIGQRVGEYEILALLGADGMGQVYSAASAVPSLPHFFKAEAGQKSAAPVTEAPAPSPSSGGGTAGATSNPPAETSAPAPPPKEPAISQPEAAPSPQLDSKAEAARSNIEQLYRQPLARGLSLKGDISTSLNRINASVGEASRSLNESDFGSANASMERAKKGLSTGNISRSIGEGLQCANLVSLFFPLLSLS
jgi:hypothetical protein